MRRFLYSLLISLGVVLLSGASAKAQPIQSVASINQVFSILDSFAGHEDNNTHIFDSTVSFGENYYFSDPLVAYIFTRNYDDDFYGDAYVFSSFVSSTTSLYDWVKLQAHRQALRSGRTFQYSLFKKEDNYILWNFNLIGEPPKLSVRLNANTIVTFSFGQDFSDQWLDYTGNHVLNYGKR